jgi:hypothetical protein
VTARNIFSEAPWLLKLLQAFEFKPAFAGAFALALCLVLVFGIVFAERPDYSAPQPLLQTAEAHNSAPLTAFHRLHFRPTAETFRSNLLAPAAPIPRPAYSPSLRLFGQQNPFAQQVSFYGSGQLK